MASRPKDRFESLRSVMRLRRELDEAEHSRAVAHSRAARAAAAAAVAAASCADAEARELVNGRAAHAGGETSRQHLDEAGAAAAYRELAAVERERADAARVAAQREAVTAADLAVARGRERALSKLAARHRRYVANEEQDE